MVSLNTVHADSSKEADDDLRKRDIEMEHAQTFTELDIEKLREYFRAAKVQTEDLLNVVSKSFWPEPDTGIARCDTVVLPRHVF